MTDEKTIKLLELFKKELNINIDDYEYIMYLEEKIIKAYKKAKELNLTEKEFILKIKEEIPNFLKNYQGMLSVLKKQEEREDSSFGISINVELIELFEIADLCKDNKDFEEKRDRYFKELSTEPRFNFKNFIFPGLESISLEQINNIKNNISSYVDCFTPEWSSKMRMIVDIREKLIDNGKINEKIFNFDYLDKIAKFARENNLKIRLHTIIWHTMFPSILENATKEEILLFLDKYMFELNKRYGDIIYTVDVLNEIASEKDDKVLRDSPWLEKLGDDYYIEILKIARNHFKNIQLAYNEFGEENQEKRKRIIEIINRIKRYEEKKGIILLDVVGLQSHYCNQTMDENLINAYKEFLTLGKELQVTEFDVTNNGNQNSIDLETNRVYRTVLDRASVSNVRLINIWGVSSNISCKSKKVNNFLDEQGNLTIYAKKIIKSYSKKYKTNKIIKNLY